MSGRLNRQTLPDFRLRLHDNLFVQFIPILFTHEKFLRISPPIIYPVLTEWTLRRETMHDNYIPLHGIVVTAANGYTGVIGGKIPGCIVAIFKFCWYCSANKCWVIKPKLFGGRWCGAKADILAGGKTCRVCGVDEGGTGIVPSSGAIGGLGDLLRRRLAVLGPSDVDSVLEGDGAVDVGLESHAFVGCVTPSTEPTTQIWEAESLWARNFFR